MSQDGGKLRCRIAQVPQYCVYSAMPKSPNQLSNCLNRAKTSVILSVFDGVLCDVRAYTVTVSVTIHGSGTRKAISIY